MERVPYRPDYLKWERHFQNMANRMKMNRKGRSIIVSPNVQEGAGVELVTMVTPQAQVIEMANAIKRKSSACKPHSSTKRRKGNISPSNKKKKKSATKPATKKKTTTKKKSATKKRSARKR